MEMIVKHLPVNPAERIDYVIYIMQKDYFFPWYKKLYYRTTIGRNWRTVLAINLLDHIDD